MDRYLVGNSVVENGDYDVDGVINGVGEVVRNVEVVTRVIIIKDCRVYLGRNTILDINLNFGNSAIDAKKLIR